MKERFPSLIALFLLILLVLGTWWAADYTQHAVPTDPPRRLTHEMDAWSRDFVMVRSGDDGKPINRLEGDYGEHYPDDDSYEVTNPRAVGLRPNTPITVATSDAAVMYDGGKRIVMNKNAHMHRQPDADTPPLDVRSEQLVLIPDDDLIKTGLPALVTRGQSRMNGTGMQYNNKTRQLEVYSATNVEIAPSDTQRATPNNRAKPAEGSPSGDAKQGAKPPGESSQGKAAPAAGSSPAAVSSAAKGPASPAVDASAQKKNNAKATGSAPASPTASKPPAGSAAAARQASAHAPAQKQP